MGCDIHTHIFKKDTETQEYKEIMLYTSDGEVVSHCAPYNDRRSDLFGLLASVRGEDWEFTAVRGLPEWCPQYIKDDMEWCHSATWYDWTELQAYARMNDIIAHWVQDIRFVLECYRVWFPHPGEVIVVIYFDN